MPFKGTQARGGARKGAGRKPTAYTQLKRRVIAEQIAEAEKSFDFYIRVRDNPDEPTDLRMAAADKILDRVLGKATQVIGEDPSKRFDSKNISVFVHNDNATP